MIAVAMVDSNWAIGSNGDQPIRLKNDLERFKHLTEGKTVIYGSNTLGTFPNKKPLPNRKNILLSRRAKLEFDSGIDAVYPSIDALIQHVDTSSDDVIVIGGSSVYHQLISFCKKAIITKVDIAFKDANTYFPRIDKSCVWKFHNDCDYKSQLDCDIITGNAYMTSVLQFTFDENKYNELSDERVIMNWADINIDLLRSDNEELFITNLGELCIKLGFKDGFTGTKSVGSYTDPASRLGPVYRSIKHADVLWEYACAHVKSMYSLDLQRLGVLMLLYMTPYEEPYRDIITRAIATYTEDLDHISDHTAKESQIPLLKRYFNIFQTLGTYRTDPDQYSTETERELHKELLDIYMDIME